MRAGIGIIKARQKGARGELVRLIATGPDGVAFAPLPGSSRLDYRKQSNLFLRDPADPYLGQEAVAELPPGLVVRRLVALALPNVRVDVGAHLVDGFLRQGIEAAPFRQAVPHQLVEPLAFRLVGGLVGAREVGRAQPVAGPGRLYPREIGELGPVVGQVDGEYPPHRLVAYRAERGPDPRHGARRVALLDDEPELEAVFRERDGEQGLPVGGLADDGVVLGDVLPRAGPHPGEVVAVGPAHEGPDVLRPDAPRLALQRVAEPDVPPQLAGLDGEAAPVAEPPHRPLGRELPDPRIRHVDVVERLPLRDPVGHDGVDVGDGLFRELRPAPRDRPVGPAPPLGLGEVVEGLGPVAERPRRAAVAHPGDPFAARGVHARLADGVVLDLPRDRGLAEPGPRGNLGYPHLAVDADLDAHPVLGVEPPPLLILHMGTFPPGEGGMDIIWDWSALIHGMRVAMALSPNVLFYFLQGLNFF